jgi:hypothetical protein
MPVPYYAYLTLKIPGPRGTITVKAVSKYPTLVMAEYARLKGKTDHNVSPGVGWSLPDQAFDATQDSKKIQVNPMDPNKTTSIAVNLDPA